MQQDEYIFSETKRLYYVRAGFCDCDIGYRGIYRLYHHGTTVRKLHRTACHA